MLGSILSNLLLVLGRFSSHRKRQEALLIRALYVARRYSIGCSFAAGGFVYSQSQFRQTAAQTSASLMTLSCITLVIPAACKCRASLSLLNGYYIFCFFYPLAQITVPTIVASLMEGTV